MPIKVVLLNGPSGSGKTTLGRGVAELMGAKNATAFGFADDLKRAVHCVHGLFDTPFDQFENCKNTPMEEFYGKTPRQAYIDFSESYMKLMYGKDIFARMCARKIDNLYDKLNWGADSIMEVDHFFIMTDCGFDSEAEHLIRYFGKDNIFLIRLARPGRTFVGDSRNYIFTKDCASIWFQNDGDNLDRAINDLANTVLAKFNLINHDRPDVSINATL